MRAFKIKDRLDSDMISELNDIAKNEKIMIIIPNTKGITSDLISSLSSNVCVSVKGGLTKDKFDSEHYQRRTHYSPNELSVIISKFEKIERLMNPMWNDLEKAMFVYMKLAEFSTYDENEFNGKDAARNLLGMITGKSVCAGYSMIYKEAMDRIGVKCHYQNRKHHHAWNVLEIDGKYHPVDLTWDTYNKKNNRCNFLYFARQGEEFYSNKHHDISNEDEEVKFPLSSVPKDKLEKTLKTISRSKSIVVPVKDESANIGRLKIDIRENIPFTDNASYTYIREDGSKFLVYPTGKYDKGVYEYVYAIYSEDKKAVKATKIYSEMSLVQEDEELRKNIADNLMTSARMNEKIGKFNGYIGYVTHGSRHYDKQFEENVISKYR